MREIKFRAWDTRDKKYLTMDKQEFIMTPHSSGVGITIPYSKPGLYIDEECFDWADADLLMGRYKPEQYIGLKDGDGKEIYEGDVVVGLYYSETLDQKIYSCKYEVVYDDEQATFWLVSKKDDRSFYPLGYFMGLEIIGNVHEGEK